MQIFGILTIAAILGKIAIITILAIHAFIAKIAIVTITAVKTFDTVITPIIVQRIFQKIAAGAQIRILAAETIIAKIRINAFVIHNTNPRHAFAQLLKILKEPHDRASYNKT